MKQLSKDRRRLQRWELQIPVPISDANSNKYFGHIANINENGIMISSVAPIQLNQTFSLKINLPDLEKVFLGKDISVCILFKAQICWIKVEVKPFFFIQAGLMFLEISSDGQKAIENVMRNIADNRAWNNISSSFQKLYEWRQMSVGF